MKKLIYLIVVIVVLGFVVSGCIPVVPPAEQDESETLPNKSPGYLYVPSDYSTIQAAINAAISGDTIIVAAGTYTELITVNKLVTLISDTGDYRTTGTILTGAMRIRLIDSAGGATIQGFRFENITSSVEFVSIEVDNITIQDNSFNKIISSGGVIILSRYGSEHTTIQDNSFKDITGHAVAMYSGAKDTDWHIIGNKIDGVMGMGNKSGFQLFGLSDSEISNNEISNCIIYAGMLFDGLENVVISDNIIKNTYRKGIQVANSSNVVIENNYITNTNTSQRPDEGAISIYPDVTNILIEGNTLTGNYQGFTVRDKDGAVAADVYVNFNNIYGNDGFGVGNFAQGGGTLNATNNWWGHASGPGGEEGRTNPAGKIIGKGDEVSINVNWDPWLSHPVTPTQIANKWDLEGMFEAHPGYNWGGRLEEGAIWEYSIHIKEAMSGDFSVGSINFTTGNIDITGIVEQTKSDYDYWSGSNLAAAGRAEYDNVTYNFFFLFSKRAIWFAISQADLEPSWSQETVWPGSLREYQLHSKVPDETFIMDPKNIH